MGVRSKSGALAGVATMLAVAALLLFVQRGDFGGEPAPAGPTGSPTACPSGLDDESEVQICVGPWINGVTMSPVP
jgi:hypothetical protein